MGGDPPAGRSRFVRRWSLHSRPIALFARERHGAHREAGSAADYHQWLHAQLGISEEQNAALHPIEEDFEQKRNALTEQIREANAELGDAMQEDKAKTPRVEAILARIHAAQKAIQEETIHHFFEMKPHLTEAQFEKLLGLMTDALHGAPHSHPD